MANKQNQTNQADDLDQVDEQDQVEQEDQIEIDKVSQLENELTTARQDHLRAVADYKNLERRIDEHQRRTARLACIELVHRILEPMDHLRMTIGHQKDQTTKDALEMILKQFEEALTHEGIQELKSEGQAFSTETMEVSETKSVEDKNQDEKVLQVIRKGYSLTIDEKPFVIRPAMVVVGKYEEKK